MFNKVLIAIVHTMICATCLPATERDGSGSADQNIPDVSAVNYPVKIPL